MYYSDVDKRIYSKSVPEYLKQFLVSLVGVERTDVFNFRSNIEIQTSRLKSGNTVLRADETVKYSKGLLISEDFPILASHIWTMSGVPLLWWKNLRGLC